MAIESPPDLYQPEDESTHYEKSFLVSSSLPPVIGVSGLFVDSDRPGPQSAGTLPADYIRPGPITALGKAPGLMSQLLSQGSSRTYAIIFGKYDEFMAGLTEFAENNQLKASHFTAIGAFHEALFGWFDGEKKAYKKIPITQQVEVISLVGDIGLVNGKPVVHAHGVVGLEDGTTRGGHIISAKVWPTLELFLIDEPRSLVKQEDPDTGLFLFHPES